MSLNRYAKRRDTTEGEIVAVLRAAGFHVELIDRPVDAIASRAGRWYLLEFKTGKKKTTTAQNRFIAEARAPVVILRSAGDAVAWVSNPSRK